MTPRVHTEPLPTPPPAPEKSKEPPDIAIILQQEAYLPHKDRHRLKGHSILHKFSDDENIVYKNDKDKSIHWGLRGSIVTKDFLVDAELLAMEWFNLDTPLADERMNKARILYKELRKQYPDNRLVLSGHSLAGGVLTNVLHHNRQDDNLEGHAFHAWYSGIPSESTKDDRLINYDLIDPLTSFLRDFEIDWNPEQIIKVVSIIANVVMNPRTAVATGFTGIALRQARQWYEERFQPFVEEHNVKNKAVEEYHKFVDLAFDIEEERRDDEDYEQWDYEDNPEDYVDYAQEHGWGDTMQIAYDAMLKAFPTFREGRLWIENRFPDWDPNEGPPGFELPANMILFNERNDLLKAITQKIGLGAKILGGISALGGVAKIFQRLHSGERWKTKKDLRIKKNESKK